MFIGHFAIAFLLARLFPQVPLLISLVAVSFPDLVWPLLVFAGIEKVKVNPESALQKYLVFEKYPYSHSLIFTNFVALAIGLTLALILSNPLVALVFTVGSASHWILDSIVHLPDLPVLGFGRRDRKIGLGLWRNGHLAFVLEFIFYAAVTRAVLPGRLVSGALLLGSLFHLVNANSFFGFTRKNPFKTPASYALITLIGFALFIFFASKIKRESK
jgi:hypothetical protein